MQEVIAGCLFAGIRQARGVPAGVSGPHGELPECPTEKGLASLEKILGGSLDEGEAGHYDIWFVSGALQIVRQSVEIPLGVVGLRRLCERRRLLPETE